MVSKINSRKLSSGFDMPVVGLGTYARKADPGQFKQAVEWGIEAGYRHIDTAAIYGNEVEVGEGINNKIKEGLVTRDELFVTTKLWNNRHAESDVVPTLKESLSKLKLDYVDLYLVHWPFSVTDNGEDANIDYLETWRGMEEAVKLNLTKSIGVSNFNEAQLERLIQAANIKPVVNQIEINPTLTQYKLVDVCNKLSVVPVAYTPLGLISDARPEFIGKDVIKTDPKLTSIAEKYGKTRAQVALRYLINPTLTQYKLVDVCNKLSVVPVAYTPLGLISDARPEFIGKDVIKTDPKLTSIAEKYGKTRAQVALRYLIQRDIVVIPKSFTKSRIEENIDLFNFELTQDEMKTMDSYNLDHRCVPASQFAKMSNYPF